jgi:purine nucleosidase
MLALDLPLTLIPYDAGRGALIGAADLEGFARQGPAQAWLAAEAQGWLAFWQEEVGLDGFYPFDWVAAVWLVAPGMFDCAAVRAEVRLEFAFWVWPRRGLVVAQETGARTFYCPRTAHGLQGMLLAP